MNGLSVADTQSAQGAAQAIEDAAVMGTLLAKVRTNSQILATLSRYESIRKPRTGIICLRSQAMKDIMSIVRSTPPATR